MMCIYKITNLLNHKSYIGQTIDYEKRKQQHLYGSKTSLIDEVIEIDGAENFSFEVIKEVENKESLSYWEDYYIMHYKTFFPQGYNRIWNTSQEIREELQEITKYIGPTTKEKRNAILTQAFDIQNIVPKNMTKQNKEIFDINLDLNGQKLLVYLGMIILGEREEGELIIKKDQLIERLKKIISLDRGHIKNNLNILVNKYLIEEEDYYIIVIKQFLFEKLDDEFIDIFKKIQNWRAKIIFFFMFYTENTHYLIHFCDIYSYLDIQIKDSRINGRIRKALEELELLNLIKCREYNSGHGTRQYLEIDFII